MKTTDIRYSAFSEAKTLPIVGNEIEVTGRLSIPITLLHNLSFIYSMYIFIVLQLLPFQSKGVRLMLGILKQKHI